MKEFVKENNVEPKIAQLNALTLNVSLGHKRSIDFLSSPLNPTSSSSKICKTSNIFGGQKSKFQTTQMPENPFHVDRYKSDVGQNDEKNSQLFYGMKYDPVFFNQCVNLLRVERLGDYDYDSDVESALNADDDDSCYSCFSSDSDDDEYTSIYARRDSQETPVSTSRNNKQAIHLSSSNSINSKHDLSINIGRLSINGHSQSSSIFRVSSNDVDSTSRVIDATIFFKRS